MSGLVRVTHVVSGDLWAGAEVATFHLLRALSERDDVEVDAIVLNEGELTRRLAGAGIPVCVLSEATLPFPRLARETRRRLRERGAHIVHAHRAKENALAALSGLPWVTTRHGRPEPFRGIRALRAAGLRALDDRVVRRGARRALAVSEEVQEYLVRRLPAERVVRARNGIRDPLAGRAPRPWRERDVRVGWVGRLAPVKDAGLAIEAVARLPGLALDVIGDGPERGALERRARRLGVCDRVRFRGFLPNAVSEIARWRALLVTSRHEGHPIAVLEALAVGTPVASAPLRGVADILGGRGGRLAAARTSDAVAVALSRVLEGDGTALALEARQRFLGDFSDAGAAAAVARIYRGVVAEEPGARPVAASRERAEADVTARRARVREAE